MENTEPSSIPHSDFPVPRCVLLDEFAAVLDRTLAQVLAFNLRKLVSRTGVGVLCATTHDDLAEEIS